MRGLRVLLVAMLLLAARSAPVRAQGHNLDEADHTGLTPIGHTYLLAEKWKVKQGDDLQWASPDYDDSKWSTTLSPADYSGFEWYRQTVTQPHADGPLSLWISKIRTSAEIYVNGERIAQVGVPGKWWTDRREIAPPALIPNSACDGQKLVIAVRLWRIPKHVSEVGILSVPEVGSEAVLERAFRAEQFDRLQQWFVSLILGLFELLLCVGALVYWRGRRDRAEAGWFALIQAGFFTWTLGDFSRVFGAPDVIDLIQSWVFAASLLASWFFFDARQHVNRITKILLYALAGAVGLALSLGDPGFLSWRQALILPIAGTLIFLARNTMDVWTRARAGDREILYLFVPYAVAKVGETTFWLQYFTKEGPGMVGGLLGGLALMNDPFRLELKHVGELLGVMVMAAVLTRRVSHLARQKQALDTELDAARQVQELLLPKHDLATPGFVVESSYVPAQQVGGDFYQVLPGSNRSLLVVVGDVSGKGLKAAMTASAVVGALRNEDATDPAQVLSRLNDVVRRSNEGGFVTCLCALFEADGTLRFANAGHLWPYAKGTELAADSGLPLGLAADAEYETARYHVGLGETVTMMSDGVVEATNTNNELFGFERVAEISVLPAQRIAEAALTFGQADDITVVTVQRKLSSC